MRFFNLNKKGEARFKSEDRKIAYFRSGILYDVFPRNSPASLFDDRDIAYQSDVYVSDGEVFNLLDRSDIIRLPAPNQNNIDLSSAATLLDMSYIFKIYCCSREDGRYASVIPELVKKCFEIMVLSRLNNWTRGDYLRLIRCFWTFNLPAEGAAFEADAQRRYPECFRRIADTEEIVRHLPPHINEAEWRIHVNQKDDALDLEHEREKARYLRKWKITAEYEKLKQFFPELVPKNAAGYAQIRTKKTKRYHQLREKGERIGLIFLNDKDLL